MFKVGNIVTYCGKTEDAGFDVRVTDVDTLRVDEFYGVIVHANAGSYFEEHSDEEHAWDVKQFKLKQQDVIPDSNAFPVLKDGMIVTTRERGSYLVCGDKFLQPNGYNRISEYLPDGKSNDFPEYDIVKVWSGVSLWSLNFDYYTKNRSDEIIWQEQKNAKAIAEIEQQMADLQEQISTLQEKLAMLREEK